MNTQEMLAKLDRIQESLKHLPGEHDQQTHAGSRGSGGASGGVNPAKDYSPEARRKRGAEAWAKAKKVDSIDILDDRASEYGDKKERDAIIARQARAVESYFDAFDAKGSMKGPKGVFKVPKTTDTNEMFDTMADDGWEGEGSSGNNWALSRGDTTAELKGRTLTVSIG